LAKRAWGTAVQNREEQFDLKRAAVLNTAARPIKERGYENVSLADIADELHIAKPTLYHYFNSKRDLVRELFALAIGQFLDPADHPEDHPFALGLNGAQKLERYIRRAARIVVDDIGSSLVTLPASSPETGAAQPNSQAVQVMAVKIIRSGIADGSLSPCDVEANYHFIVGTLRHLPFWFAGGNRTLKDVSDTLVQVKLDCFRYPSTMANLVGEVINSISI
jgi:AcrR family transcriptional regulator